MSLTDQSAISAVLRRFDRLAALDDHQIDRLAAGSELRYAPRGTCLLTLGALEPRQLFLVDGEVRLEAADGAAHSVRHDDGAAKAPVSRLRPSRYRVTALSDVRYLLVNEQLLDDHAHTPAAAAVLVDESYLVSEPNGLLDDTASHPIMFDLFSDLNLGRVMVPSDRDVAIRVGRALNPSESDARRLAGILAVCPALTVKILRAARSSQPKAPALRSTRTAVERLGAEDIFALAVNCVLRESLRSDSAVVRDRMRAWWERTMRIAAVSGALAGLSERFDPSYARLIGLLHSIAEPVLLGYADRHPDLADPAVLDDVLHANRAELGRILLAMWELPKDVVAAACFCNHWGYDHPGEADYTDLVLAAQWQVAAADGHARRYPPAAEIPALRRLGLDRSTAEVDSRINTALDGALGAIDQLLSA